MRNDDRILDAAVSIAASHGWAALVPSRVAADSGLVRSTVQERFRDRASLGAALWEHRCATPMERALAGVVAAGVPSGRRQPQRADVAESLSRLCRPDPELLAGTELVVAAHYDAATADAVRASLGAVVKGWCTDGRAENGARSGYLAMVGLGLLLAARRTGAESLDWDHVAGAIAEAAAEDREAHGEAGAEANATLEVGAAVLSEGRGREHEERRRDGQDLEQLGRHGSLREGKVQQG